MNCRRARNLVFDFIDGIADESVRLALEGHLADCRECEKLAGEVTRSMDLLHRAPVETLDENFNWKVRLAAHKERHALQEGVASQGALFRAWNFRYAASAAAGFVVVVAASWMALSTGAVSIGGGGATLDRSNIYAGGSPTVTRTIRQPDRPVFSNRSLSSAVSTGTPVGERALTPVQGPIDASHAPVNLDSLIQVEMSNQSEPDRIKYLEKHIHLLNEHLDKCKQKKHE